MIVIQELVSRWEKNHKSDGILRNQVPREMLLPFKEQDLIDELKVFHHSVDFNGKNGFEASNEKLFFREVGSPWLFQSGGVWIRSNLKDSQLITVKFIWNKEVGAPQRANRQIGNLKKGDWLQVQYNGRTAINGTLNTQWQYAQHTVNIAYVDDLKKNLFLSSSPSLQFEELAILK